MFSDKNSLRTGPHFIAQLRLVGKDAGVPREVNIDIATLGLILRSNSLHNISGFPLARILHGEQLIFPCEGRRSLTKVVHMTKISNFEKGSNSHSNCPSISLEIAIKMVRNPCQILKPISLCLPPSSGRAKPTRGQRRYP